MIEKSIVEISLDSAIGKICAQRVVPYPPGVPLIVEGELIQEAHIHLLKTFLPYQCVFGITDQEQDQRQKNTYVIKVVNEGDNDGSIDHN